MKSVYKQILKELRIIQRQSHKVHEEANIVRLKTLLEYRKLELLKHNKPINDIQAQIDGLSTTEPKYKFVPIFKELFKEFDEDSRIKSQNLDNVYKFLNSQRTYDELLKRYNPGINASENIEKSANRVGLKVPQ